MNIFKFACLNKYLCRAKYIRISEYALFDMVTLFNLSSIMKSSLKLTSKIYIYIYRKEIKYKKVLRSKIGRIHMLNMSIYMLNINICIFKHILQNCHRYFSIYKTVFLFSKLKSITIDNISIGMLNTNICMMEKNIAFLKIS